MSLPVKPENPILTPYLLRNFWLDSLVISLKNIKDSQKLIDEAIKENPLAANIQSNPMNTLLEPLQQESQTTLAAAVNHLIYQTEELRENFWPFELKTASTTAAATPVATTTTQTEAKPQTTVEDIPAQSTASDTTPVKTAPKPQPEKIVEKRQAAAKKTPAKTTAKTKPAKAKAVPKAVPQDLTMVKGIGPVFADKLVANGITRFEHIAKWKAKDIEHIENVVFEGKRSGGIARDGWVSQAKKLAKQKSLG